MNFENHYDRGDRRLRQDGAGRGCLTLLFRHPRILGALVFLLIGVFTYYSRTEEKENPFTGQEVRVILTPEQETALGLQAVPQMMREFGGESRNAGARELVNRIGAKLLAAKDDILRRRGLDDFDYQFQFRVLADRRTINAFALPGGPVFITEALVEKLPSEDAVAGVIGHEIGHVLAWHSNKQMAKNSLLQAAANAAAVATSDGTGSGGAIGQLVGQVLQTKYGREDETESDRIGVQLMMVAGYKPEALLTVMDVLEKSKGEGMKPPEWLSSHPTEASRRDGIRKFIEFFRRDPFGVWK
jgi:predicted Zn-dependent protease